MREQLPLFVSLDLDRGTDAVVRTHLLDCAACRRELRGYMDAADVLRAATGPEMAPAGAVAPDDAFFAELLRRILGETVFRSDGFDGGTTDRPAAGLAIGSGSGVRRAVVAAGLMFGLGLGLAALLVPRGARDELLDGAALTAGERVLQTPLDGTRFVGQRTWTGLKGRSLADRLLTAPYPDEPALPTREMPVRSKPQPAAAARDRR